MLELKEILGEDIDSENKKYLQNMRRKLDEDKLTWILGAGISVPAGLPQWDLLLMNMWGLLTEVNRTGSQAPDVFEGTYDKLMSELKRDSSYKKEYLEKFTEEIRGKGTGYLEGINVLEAAEYLWNIIEEKNIGSHLEKTDMMNLKSLIQEALRLGMQYSAGDLDKKESELLKGKIENECAGIIAKILGRHGQGEAIVYNFDDLFEFCLERVAGLEEKEVWIGCDNCRYPGNQKIRVYHPHGKIHLFSEWKPRESDNIVLTESSYYSMESKVYNWANSIQAKALAEKSCVFVGFSGVDYNFRRIIKNCHELKDGEEARHYIFIGINSLVKKIFANALKKEHEISGETDTDKILRKIFRDPSYIFERVQMINLCFAQQRYWKKYGIVPIWTTYHEMPGLLNTLLS